MALHRKSRGLASNCWCCNQGVTTGVRWASSPAIRKPKKANKGCHSCGELNCLGHCEIFSGGCGCVDHGEDDHRH
jgi:hypothetical protein